MSLVSIEKYLRERSTSGLQSQGEEADVAFAVIQDILECVQRYQLHGELVTDLCGEVRSIQATLAETRHPKVYALAASQIREILQQSRERTQKAEIARNQEFGNVLNMLSEALTHVSSRNERARNKYKTLEESLQTAAKLDNITAIRRRLANLLEFVRSEEQYERETGDNAENSLGAGLQEAQQSAARFRVRLSNRTEAVREIQLASDKGEGLHGALFTSNQLQSIRTRHGNEVCDDVIDALGRKELQVLVPSASLYSWSPASILLLWKKGDGIDPREEILSKLKSAYEQRILVANRMATFRVSFKSLVTRLEGSITDISNSLDYFERGLR